MLNTGIRVDVIFICINDMNGHTLSPSFSGLAFYERSLQTQTLNSSVRFCYEGGDPPNSDSSQPRTHLAGAVVPPASGCVLSSFIRRITKNPFIYICMYGFFLAVENENKWRLAGPFGSSFFCQVSCLRAANLQSTIPIIPSKAKVPFELEYASSRTVEPAFLNHVVARLFHPAPL